MTTGGGTDDAAADAWRSVRDDPDIQFAPIEPREQRELPAWLEAIVDFLVWIFSFVARAFVAAWPVLQWVLVGIGVILLVLLVARVAGLPVFRRRDQAPDSEDAPTIDRAEAQALLGDAEVAHATLARV